MRGLHFLILCISITAVSHGAAQVTNENIPLSVHVIDAVTRQARSDVYLFLQDLKWRDVAGPVQPDSAGNADFHLPEGGYILRAEGSGFTVQYGKLPDGMVQTVSVAAAAADQSKPIIFAVASPASLSGYVRDAAGEPLPDVSVHLMRSFWRESITVFDLVATAQTDDRGYYRMHGITAGAYILCGFPTQSMLAPEIGLVNFAQPLPARYYQRTCIPGDPVSVAAPALQISPGQHANVDLVLAATPAATVKGRVTGDFSGIRLQLVPDSRLRNAGSTPSTFVSGGDHADFSFPPVTPGRYRLEGYGEKRSDKGKTEPVFAAMLVEVGTAGLDGLEVTPLPAVSIELKFQESEPGLADGIASVGLVLADQARPETRVVPGTDKITKFPLMRPGIYWLRTRTNSARKMCVAGARLGDEDIFRKPVVLAPGWNGFLTLALSTHCAQIEGHVLSNGKPAPWARIVALLSGTPENPGDPWVVLADEDGDFSLSEIAPGRYRIWAWEDDDSGLSAGPRDLASIARSATVVDAREGKAEKLTINVLDLREARK